MWASSEVAFTGCIRIGEEATRSSVIEDIAEKQGRTGPLIFVIVETEITAADGEKILSERYTRILR